MPEEIKDTLNPEEDTSSPEEITPDPNLDVDAGEEKAEGEEAPEEVTGNWYDNLEPDFRNDPDITKYKTLQEYAKGNREVRKLIGKNKLVVPSKDAPKEEVDKFFEAIGRPKEASAYAVPEIELPDEIKATDDAVEAFRTKAFELGLTEKQFSELYALQSQLNLNTYNQELDKIKNLKAESEKALRGDWGAAYDTKIDNAQKVINHFFKGKKIHPAFEALSNDQGFIRAMSELSEHIGEDAIAGEVRQTMTPVEAQKEWDSIVAGNHDLSKAYFDELNPEHSTAVERVLSLQTMASAGQS